ncbi:MAG: hypothetical protein LBH69_06025 [Methanomassiliicoccaceae archaeon]|jgi:hypothetical protein|nr:hypothetical protein [Methanomassiliicoccaceae archaeon]
MAFLKDKYILFSAAAVLMLIVICAVGSFNTEGTDGNGITEITGVISDPNETKNGTTFRITDLNGNEFRCFSGAGIPGTPSLCRLTGSFSPDGNMFFVDAIAPGGVW